MLNDIWVLATRNITMTMLSIAASLALWCMPVFVIFIMPIWIHVCSGIMTDGKDLQLRVTPPVKTGWLWSLGVFVFVIIYAVLYYALGEPDTGATSTGGFDYWDVVSICLDVVCGYFVLTLVAWTAAPKIDLGVVQDAFIRALAQDRSAKKSSLLTAVLFAASMQFKILSALAMLASCAWVLRYMLGKPPKRKRKAKSAKLVAREAV